MTPAARASIRFAAVISLSLVPAMVYGQDSVKTAIQRPSSDLITREQILESKASSAYEVIESLHNNWYNVRIPAPAARSLPRDTAQKGAIYTDDALASGRSAPGSSGGIQVYLDGSRVGGTDELKKIRPGDIYSIRRYTGAEAQARYGIGHSAGALLVSTMTNGQNTKP